MGISDGGDDIRGTNDDFHFMTGPGNTPADAACWFRRIDNNPFVVDSTVIDSQTYSRSVAAQLPPGHTWAAVSSRRVGETLGFASSQSVMYGRTVPTRILLGLGADDVNTVRMARTGEDRLAGTADDYTIELVHIPVCDGTEDVQVLFDPTLADTDAAQCQTLFWDYAFPPANPLTAIHYKLHQLSSGEPYFLLLNANKAWDLGAGIPYFDGFETGDFSRWSSVAP